MLCEDKGKGKGAPAGSVDKGKGKGAPDEGKDKGKGKFKGLPAKNTVAPPAPEAAPAAPEAAPATPEAPRHLPVKPEAALIGVADTRPRSRTPSVFHRALVAAADAAAGDVTMHRLAAVSDETLRVIVVACMAEMSRRQGGGDAAGVAEASSPSMLSAVPTEPGVEDEAVPERR